MAVGLGEAGGSCLSSGSDATAGSWVVVGLGEAVCLEGLGGSEGPGDVRESVGLGKLCGFKVTRELIPPGRLGGIVGM